MVDSKQTRVMKKKKKSRKRILWMLSFVLIVMLTVFGYGLKLYLKADSVLSDAYENDGREKSDYRDKVVDPKFDNVSILIMGVDASDTRANEDNSRTDALMLATLNKDAKSVKLLSIPRDSLVYIPEVDRETRINHAHAYGGPRATIETVERLLNIPVDYYVKVNFNAFIDVVDALNGINVDVPYEFMEQDSSDRANAIHLFPGMQKLDGEEALALARTRKKDSDMLRGQRQQQIIKAIVDRTVSLNSILKYDDIIEAVGSNMTTNMLFSEMKSFISYGTNGPNIDIETLQLAGSDLWTPAYYYQLDEESLVETIATLQEHLEITPPLSPYTESAQPAETETSPY